MTSGDDVDQFTLLSGASLAALETHVTTKAIRWVDGSLGKVDSAVMLKQRCSAPHLKFCLLAFFKPSVSGAVRKARLRVLSALSSESRFTRIRFLEASFRAPTCLNISNSAEGAVVAYFAKKNRCCANESVPDK